MKGSEASIDFVFECLCKLAISPLDMARKIDAFYRGRDPDDYEANGSRIEYLPGTEFDVQCRGRDKDGNEVLIEPFTQHVAVTLMEDGKSLHASTSSCPFACGKHGGFCKAKSREENALCPYDVQMPFIIDNFYIVPKDKIDDSRFKELVDRLVAPGSNANRFSASEYHELYGHIVALRNTGD